MKTAFCLTTIGLLLAASSLSAATHYVSLGSTNPTPPYGSWLTAATNIQDAMNTATGGDVVVVTNGVYRGWAQVYVYSRVTLLSINGPQSTVISGGGPCVILADGASLTGFTLTNGSASWGGGVYCSSTNAFLTNCVLTGNSAWAAYTTYGCGGGAYGCTLYNCTLSGNSAHGAVVPIPGYPSQLTYLNGWGGGAYNSTLYNCTLSGNVSTNYGGGAYGCTLYNCTLSGNWARNSTFAAGGFWNYVPGDGGGAFKSTLYNCTLSGNWADSTGGGTASDPNQNGSSILSNCTLTANSAYEGGGAAGGTLIDCTLTGNWATGPAGNGGGAYQGTLSNCALTGNSSRYGGGGAYGCTLYNCTLAGNSCVDTSGAAYGGGARGGTLYSCTLSSNSAPYGFGGGAYDSTLYSSALSGNSAREGGGAAGSTLFNCTLTGNSASQDGGVGVDWNGHPNTLYNCIVYFNTATVGANYATSNTFSYCCTTPMPTNGIGNLTNAPLFVDYANGNLRLQSNSQCINTGNNGYMTNSTDLDGRPRIVGGTVDMGAYEFQLGLSGAFIGWLQRFGLPIDGSADFVDCDHDGMNNWQEWICGTCPTNPLSVLRLVSATRTGPNVTVTWQSVGGVNYSLERSSSLGLSALFTPLATGIPGQAGTTAYTDTNAANASALFYRVGVGN